MSSILPPNATAQELELESATARIAEVPVLIRDLWNPDTSPEALLPWLGWAFGVDEWDAQWSDEAKRTTIRDAISIQRRKGSVWSIKRAIANAGYGDSVLIEGDSTHLYDGASSYDGAITHGNPEEWAKYSFVLSNPITNAQADQVRRILAEYAPARCHLVSLIFIEAANIHDGSILYDGTYNHGVA